ncbi:solanesyl diphosphate synthase 3, chloroplastic/mitochondrial-like isoform X1 [Papaver somniferum]|uniref:solanesyl diphosphate synthase 3, chloroplastic/mitochondrial-like isoform X1 n=1 Tax=Papaver somniferum TaxID=3469 RepID=UPI000E705F0D|nr:solanesyl diphosphate synthase 3, chloroplastic/mitochondrial-like isoform X1 [Papaver somniferum]
MKFLREEQLDPYSLVADDLLVVASRLKSTFAAEVPMLASAAGDFFKMGAERKKFRPTVILLMASALNMSTLAPDGMLETSYNELYDRQLSIAVITEMIHAASLLHSDVLDDTETRRGIGSLNCFMENKMAVLAGDVLLSRALVALTSLGNNEVVALISRSVQHQVTGETMQMTAASEQRCSSLYDSFFGCCMEYYMEKTYNKTAALISNSCQAVSIITGQTAEVSMLAYDYGRNLGVAFQLIDDVLDFTGTSASLGKGSLSAIRHGIIAAPILFAIEEFPQLCKIVDRGFQNPADVDLASEILGKSNGIQRAIELASEHANLAAAAIKSLPKTDNADVRRSRQALVDLTRLVITRKR